jgi:hypothetical protein
MPAVRTRILQDDFSEGFVRDVAPQLISKAGCWDLVNALLDSDGNPYRRGGSSYKGTGQLGEAGLTWAWDGQLNPGHRTVFANGSDFGALDASNAVVNLGGEGLSAPKQTAVLEDLLFVGSSIYGGSRKTASYGTGAVKVIKGSAAVEGVGTAWAANVDPGMLFQTASDDRVYVVKEVLGNTSLVLREAYEDDTAEVGYGLDPIYTITGSDPYYSYAYKTVCAGRLVLADGRTVRFSEIGKPHDFTYTPAEGEPTANEHTMPEGVQIVGLATMAQSVLVFTTKGIWVLDGLPLSIVDENGNPQHRNHRLSADVVLADAAGLAGSVQRLVVPARDGIYLMDGVSTPRRISGPIDRFYRRRINWGYNPGGAAVYNGHYFLPILRGTSEVSDQLVCRLDRPAKVRGQTVYPWSRFIGSGGNVRAFAVQNDPEANEPQLLGAPGPPNPSETTEVPEPGRLLNCSTYFRPEAEYAEDADGTNFQFELISRDIETGEETENVIRALRLRYELEGEGGVQVAWGDGSLEPAGALWGEAFWGEFDWAPDESGATFNAVAEEAGESDGRAVHKFRINDRQRFGRFRVATVGSPWNFALRLLEMGIRPSRAVRR